ncbi:tumor necrosis factor receptor superfamily member 13B [Osmerus eperlanus]|uniref:tumor necrosis factor receptor superfamily member 13B n=1 Tax=Osmerus eperlanus TaxID=29151 RepID=UPI002E1083E4
MVEVCSEGNYWDGLVKRCISCQMVCKQTQHIVRCTDYCVSQQCRAVSGQYYDRLLKKCLRCAEVCGSHPSECSHHCQTQGPVQPSLSPVIDTALPTAPHRGHSPPRGLPHSAVLIYSLLGLCLVLLLCTLSLALVVVLRRARARAPPSRPGVTANGDAQGCEGQVGQGPNQNGLSSQDRLMNPGGSQFKVLPSVRSPSPTETCECVHCFPDLRAPARGDNHQHPPPLSVYQATTAPCWGERTSLYPRNQGVELGSRVFPGRSCNTNAAHRIH